MLTFKNKYQELQYRVEEKTINPFLSKVLMGIKSSILYLVDCLNLLYKYPTYKLPSQLEKIEGLDELNEKFKQDLKFDETTGLYIYKGTSSVDTRVGDGSIHNGIYAAYDLNTNKDTKFFRTYVDVIIEKNSADKWQLLRGITKGPAGKRTDPSGDQLTGLNFALSEYKRLGNKCPEKISEFIDIFIEDGYILKDDMNISTMFGHFNPNLLTINGSVSVVLATLAVNNRWREFNYLYNKCGYKYMLNHADIYLWNPEDTNILGLRGKRAWFSTNVGIISLCIIYRWCEDKNIREQVKKSILKILNRNTWNTWIWVLAKEYGVVSNIPKESVDYFKSFLLTEKDTSSKFYPLGGQNTNFVWQKSPFELKYKEGNSGRMDFIFVYELLKKYEAI